MELTTINTNTLDISKPAQFAEFVAQAKALSNVLEEAWGVVEQQMLDRNTAKLVGDWGTIQFETATKLVITDAAKLDAAITKPALDTEKVRAYKKLMNELPAGVAMTSYTKFVKRVK